MIQPTGPRRAPVPRRIALFGTYQAEDHPRVRVLAEGLAAHGYVITEINEPLGLTTSDRVSILRQPWRLPILLSRLLRCWWRLWRQARIQRDLVDAVLVGYLGHFDVHLAKLVFRGVPILLDHLIFAGGTAVDRGVSPGVRTRLLDLLDGAALRAADLIIVDTEEHAAQVPNDLADRVVLCLVGADEAWYAAREDLHEADFEAPLTVVFFGLFTPLQGTPVIADALARLADRSDVHVTMVGHGQEYQQCRELVPPTAAVDWLEWVAPEDLPAVVARHDVALGIFGSTTKARQVVPNKIYQAAAAGCGVVTSDTSAQRRVLGDAVRYVPADDSQALTDALLSLAGDRSQLSALAKSAATLADAEFTAPKVTATLVERIDACLRRNVHR